MIDLHTHLLPDWDDGAADRAEANHMIEEAREDGISKIVLTPHIFHMTKRDNDGNGLNARIRSFLEQPKPRGVEFYPGAEVYVHPDMIAHIKEFGLTINGSNYVFIEFPSQHVPGGAPNMIYQMLVKDLIPIISHPERNAVFIKQPERLYELIRLGAFGQVTGQSLTGEFGKPVKRAAVSFLQHGLVHVIASDAHNADKRPPRLSHAVRMAAKYVGAARAEAMVTTVPEAILKNEPIPAFAEPQEVARKGKFRL